jgi:PAS domain S-box-containing protein
MDLDMQQVELEMQNAAFQQSYQELKKSQAKYFTLYNFAPLGCFTLDRTTRILELNATGATLFGVEKQHLVGTLFSQYVDRDSHESFYLHLRQVFRSQTCQTCELTLVKKDGSRFPAKLESIFVEQENGNSSRCRTAISDISERKKVEEALQQAHEELEQRVVERTAELKKANSQLQREIERRKSIEKVLSWSHKDLLKEHHQRTLLSKRLITLQEKERHHLARELHDHIGQTLTSLKMQLEMIHDEVAPINPDVGSQLQAAKERTRQLVQEIKQIANGLKPGILVTLGLVPALREFFSDIERTSQIEIRFFSRNLPIRFDQDKELAIYRITQEALTNVIKHAQAKHVFVNLVKQGEVLSLSVEDGGVGFDQEEFLNSSARAGALGLLTMEERAIQCDGAFSIDSQPGKGTHILVEIPMEREGVDHEDNEDSHCG